ncbi:MAG: CDP-alcohol phosphatidyltransferase family protein [Chloroflexi bacterium]|nr:CDP-alcohol phosphatidyltransferase family protein [Chloroflexota bacterium]
MGVIERVRNPIVGVLVALHVHPNHITVLGAVVAGAAGWIAATGALALAASVYAIGSALDGLDGALARRTGAASAFGAYLDSLLDRVGEGLILLGLLVHFLRQDEDLGAVLTLTALLASLLVSYARARSEGLHLRASGGFAPRPIRIVILVAGLFVGQPIPALAAITALSTATVAQRTVAVWRQTRGGSA